jgi:hypothetical protein
MGSRDSSEPVSFLTVEEGDDLILAFAIAGADPEDVVSLILMRTSKFEVLVPEEERGVSVCHEALPEQKRELLRRIHPAAPITEIVPTRRHYSLDVSRVEAEDLVVAQQVLKRMNFDNRFVLEQG